MSSKQHKSESRKTKKKSSSKQKSNPSSNDQGTNRNHNSSSVDPCKRGDGFNIEQWISNCNQESDNKLSSQMLPTRAAAIKAKNGMTNHGFLSYESAKEKDPRAIINDNRLFYEEYVQPFKCIQLLNQANLEVLTYKLHSIASDQQSK